MSCVPPTCRLRTHLNTCILRDTICEKADSVGIFVLADFESKEATAWQSRVKARVCQEIDRRVQDVDEALRRMEEDVGIRGHEGPGLVEKWECARERRDAALVVLDEHAMVGCRAKDQVVGSQHKNEDAKRDNKGFIDVHADRLAASQGMVDALAVLRTQHSEMEDLEKEMFGSQVDEQGAPILDQLSRLRLQRVQRPRILYSHGVSSRTGQGLQEVSSGLTALMEDSRLFPQVGMKVPLNYSMLERLAQEGRDADGDLIQFAWAGFCTNFKLPHTNVVLCEPERADADLCNTDQLKGKIAVAKRGGNSFIEKAQRVIAAGAVGLIIVNTDDTLMKAGATASVAIPVLMIKAKDEQTLLASGDTSCLRGPPVRLE